MAEGEVLRFLNIVVVVVLGFNVPSTAKVIRRRDLGLKSHPKDCRFLNSRAAKGALEQSELKYPWLAKISSGVS